MQHYQRWSPQTSLNLCVKSRTSFKKMSPSTKSSKQSTKSYRKSTSKSLNAVSKLKKTPRTYKQRTQCCVCNLNRAKPYWRQFRRGLKNLSRKMTPTLPTSLCCRVSPKHCARRTSSWRKICLGLRIKLNLARIRLRRLSRICRPTIRSWGVWSENKRKLKLRRSNLSKNCAS